MEKSTSTAYIPAVNVKQEQLPARIPNAESLPAITMTIPRKNDVSIGGKNRRLELSQGRKGTCGLSLAG